MRELECQLGYKTLEVVILEEALDRSRSKNRPCLRRSCSGFDRPARPRLGPGRRHGTRYDWTARDADVRTTRRSARAPLFIFWDIQPFMLSQMHRSSSAGINLCWHSKRVPDIPLPLTSRPPFGACRPPLTSRHGAAGDVPHEGSHFPCDSSGDDCRLLAPLAEFAIPRRQSRLCFPGNVLNLGRLFLKDVELPSSRACWQSIGPSTFDQLMTNSGVARPGNPAALGRFSRRVFAWHEPQIRHQFYRRFKPAHVPDLGHEGDGTYQRHTPQGLQRIYSRCEVPFRHESFDMSDQPVMAFCGIALSLQHLLKGDLMRRMIEALALQPSAISHRPRPGPVIDPSVAQHEGRNELALVPLVLGRAFPGPNQVAHRLMCFIRNPDRRQLPGAKKAGQSNGIQSVCLYAITGTHRNQRGRNNTAFETKRSNLPIKTISCRPRFIAYRDRQPTPGKFF